MSVFCGGSICAARIQVWLADPDDPIIRDPCPACLDTLTALLGAEPEGPPTLASLRAVVKERL